MDSVTRQLGKLVVSAEAAAYGEGERPLDEWPVFERPKRKEHGDWSTNFALLHGKEHDTNPHDFAARLVTEIQRLAGERGESILEHVEVAGPGFINFHLNHRLLVRDVLRTIEADKEAYGHVDQGHGQKIQVEFVSANPVGPMHVGHGRWAALGDSLANVLEAAGYDVEREFYINDYGNQMNVFGASVEARYSELLGAPAEFPEDGYGGAYIYEIAREIADSDGDRHLTLERDERIKLFTERAYAQVLEHMKKTLAGMGVVFDVWFSERSLHESGAIGRAIEKLRGQGYVYDKEGAVWFASTRFGDDKDRVLVRENGQPTYLAADVAYHEDKLERGFDRIVDVWGADHHGYVKRMEAAVEALSGREGVLEVILGQLVNLLRGGEPVRMSKRTGEMIIFEELLDEVGPDAARYYFLSRSTDSAVDFDIELAKEQSTKNPVYYVQYGHARICSILRKAVAEGVVGDGCLGEAHPIDDELLARVEATDEQLARLGQEPEVDLVSHLSRLPEEVEEAAARRAPYKLTAYAYETARRFHTFYECCRVISDDAQLTAARLFLAKCTLQTLANVLGLIGVSAPDRM